MKQTELLICLLFFSLLGLGQNYTSDHSYISERIYLEATKDGSSAQTIDNVSYLDGFGRVIQEIQVCGSPVGNADLVLPYAYGPWGRTEKDYLPYNRHSNNGAYDPDPFNISNWSLYGNADRMYAFSGTTYDGSPLNRIVEKTGPGTAWHTGGKSVMIAYSYNAADEVRLYRVASNGSLIDGGNYASGRLEKTIATDENGQITETFTDNEGKTILTVSLLGNNRLETYFVYDDRGRQRWVLSPEASSRLMNGIDATVLSRYAYHYNYDRWDRLIEKCLPGMDPVLYVYDKKDRLVLSQDGNGRSAGCWNYSLYDEKNRVVETGEVILTGKTVAQLRSEAGESENYIPADDRIALQYSLYDSYTPTSIIVPHAFGASTGYAASYHPLVTGLLTATKTRILDTDTWQTTTLYYDDRVRVIQTVSDNRLGGISRCDMKYDFVDHLIQQRESHGKSSGQADVLESVNSYDNRGRLLSQSIRLNGGAAATVTCQYDAVGRLTGRKYGNLSETLSYNIRGWLTAKMSTPFRMSLRYESPQGGSAVCYNGNISEWEWQQGTNAALMYGFTYDGLSRFTGAVEKQKSGNTWSALSGHYTEQGLSYDRNGNLLGLQRTAGGAVVDHLAYSYTGNQLTGLTENVRTSPTNDIYAPGNAAVGSYSYDANGNLLNDSRRALNFDYNVLDLLSEVRSGSTVKATYTWLADGTKLGVRDGSGTNGFEYLGSLIYRKSGSGFELSEALFGDGVIRLNDNGTQEINYFLTDHLGSVRVIVDASGTVKERNDYYPFGARHVRSDYAQSTNRWKYNGKEEQTTGALDYLDYGARMYDAGLGRWMSADPLSESTFSLSPYHFCCNDPVNLTDPDGMYADHWLYNLANGSISWLSGLGGSDYQFISFAYPSPGEGYLLDKQISIPGPTVFLGPVSGGLLVSNVNYWEFMPPHLSGFQGYQYDLDDLRMRLDILNSSSHHLKVALANWESRGIAEPLTSQNYWSTYGHTAGMLNLWATYLPAGFSLSAGVGLGGGTRVTPRAFRHVSMAPVLKGTMRIQASTLKEFKSLVKKLSRPGSQLTPYELRQFESLTKQFGGKLRYDLNPVKGKILQPHVQVEGLGKSIESRHIWLKAGSK